MVSMKHLKAYQETWRSQPTTNSDPLTNPPEERASLLDALLERALKTSESEEGIRKAGLDTGEVERRLRAREDQIWSSAGEEDQALHELEERLAHAEQQLNALRRPPALLRWLAIVGLLALVGGFILFASAPTDSEGNLISREHAWRQNVGLGVALMALLAILAVVVTQLVRSAYRLRLRAALKPRSLRAQVTAARTTFAHALLEKGLLPEIRKLVNESLGPVYDTGFKFLSAQGLNESSDPRYEVPTQVGQRLQVLLTRRTGGSIGITGPRGVGKTTLIRAACSGGPRPETDSGLVWSVVVSAPVEYDPREFILYVFQTLCRTVLGPEVSGRGPDSLRWLRPVTRRGAGDRGPAWRIQERPGEDDSLGPVVARLRDEAHGFLQEIEWQQTWTHGWSGSINVPVALQMHRTSGRDLSRRPKTFPQIIHDFRTFLSHAAASGRVVIGIDELDKVESEIAAHKFLNDFKALFGLDRCFFLISVSEEAMSSFERRGLPFRDVFDSAFDEILRVPYLRLDDSIRILERRVTGLPAPFLWLCHCLSGGLARDLIRVTRTLVELDLRPGIDLRDVCLALVRHDLAIKAEAVAITVRHGPVESDVNNLLLWVRQLAEMTGPKLLEHCGTFTNVSTHLLAESRQDSLSEATADGQHILRLGLDMVTFAYLCATVLDIFGSTIIKDRLVTEEGRRDAIRIIEQLAQARQALTINPIIAWHAISELRKACQLAESLQFPDPAYVR